MEYFIDNAKVDLQTVLQFEYTAILSSDEA